MSGREAARSPRTLGLVCLGLAASAALLAGAGATVWYRVSPPGHASVAITGSEVRPSLTGIALLALAGIAAVVATSGLLRRALGAVLAAVGAWMAAVTVTDLLGSPFDSAALPQPPAGVPVDLLRHAPSSTTAAPLLALAGGLVLLAVGVFVLLREQRLARFGSRYAASGTRRAAADPDRAAWQELDAGRDPTADPSDPGSDAGDDPGGGAGRGPV